jgi:hypothetical protein
MMVVMLRFIIFLRRERALDVMGGSDVSACAADPPPTPPNQAPATIGMA